MPNLHHIRAMSMRWKRILFLACAILAVVLTWTLLTPPEREPSYQGHTLSQWLGQQEGYWGANRVLDDDPILAIGTNALPTILKWVSYEPSPLRNKIASLVERLPPGLKRRLFYVRVERANDAVRVFRTLGPRAHAAIPNSPG